MFLTREELQELTHAAQPKRMIEWLKAENFQFRVGADGIPVILREHVSLMMGRATPTFKKPDIDLSWIADGKTTRHQKRSA